MAMTSFQVLSEEKKILRRKEKEAERQKKIQEKLDQVQSGPGVSSWADASDDDDDELCRPVSDSESEASDDSDAGKVPSPKASREVQDANAKPADKSTAKSKKKQEKQPNKPAEEEDLDSVLKDFGIDLGAQETQESTSSRRRKKKENKENKEVEEESTANAGGYPAESTQKAKAGAPKPAASETIAEPDGDNEEAELDPAARQAAREALKKKQAQKGKTGKSSAATDAAKCAVAEAKKKADGKKKKPDKSMYDR
jgi:hypothetical protein